MRQVQVLSLYITGLTALALACSSGGGTGKKAALGASAASDTSTATATSTTNTKKTPAKGGDTPVCQANTASTKTSTATAKSTSTSKQNSSDATANAGDGGDGSDQGMNLDDLFLVTPTWTDVQTVLAQKCGTCHVAGVQAPTLTTADNYAANLTKVVQRVQNGTMPPQGSSQFSATDKQTVLAWLAGGALGGSSGGSGTSTATSAKTSTKTSTSTSGGGDTGSGDGSDGSDGSGGDSSDGVGGVGTATATSGDNCGQIVAANTATGTSTATATDGGLNTPDDSAFVKSMLNPALLTQCKTQGLLYNRAENKCDTAKLGAQYSCDHDGFLGAYNNNAAVKSFLDTKYQGWTFDQCGMENGHPVLLLLCIQVGGACVTQEAAAKNSSDIQLKVARIPSAGS